MHTVLLSLLVIDAIALIVVVLLQSGKSAGLSGAILAVLRNYSENKRLVELMQFFIV